MTTDANERREAVVTGLREIRAELGFIPCNHLREAAEHLERSPSTVLRWVSQGVPRGGARRPYELSPEHKRRIFEWHGCVSAAWAELHRAGEPVPSRATFQRAALRSMSAVDRAYARGGMPEARASQLRLERRETGRGITLVADHKLADVPVVVPGKGAHPVRPWITTFMCASTRAVAGIAVSVRHHRGTVLAALGQAIRRRPELTPAYGLPRLVRFDNGMENLSTAVRGAQFELGFVAAPLPPRSPWLNGKIERWHRTLTDEFISRLPYWVDGPKRANGSLAVTPGTEPLAIEVFVEALHAWVAHYNYDRVHHTLGMTPAQAWEADETPVREASDADLRRYLLETPGTRTVGPRGVQFGGRRRYYQAAELQDLVGKTVELRYMPHDLRAIEIYHEGEWICRAARTDTATEADREKVLAARASAARKAAAVSTTARAQAKVRWQTLTEAHPPQETTVVEEREAAALAGDEREQALLQALGLADRGGERT